MRRAEGYRFEGDITTGAATSHIVGVFRAPDRLQESVTGITPPVAPVDVIAIGTTAFRRAGLVEEWKPVEGAQAGDPRATFATLAGASVRAAASGAFSFRLDGTEARRLAGSTAVVTGTAAVGDHRITELDYTSNASTKVHVHLRYQPLGSAPPITAPR